MFFNLHNNLDYIIDIKYCGPSFSVSLWVKLSYSRLLTFFKGASIACGFLLVVAALGRDRANPRMRHSLIRDWFVATDEYVLNALLLSHHTVAGVFSSGAQSPKSSSHQRRCGKVTRSLRPSTRLFRVCVCVGVCVGVSYSFVLKFSVCFVRLYKIKKGKCGMAGL